MTAMNSGGAFLSRVAGGMRWRARHLRDAVEWHAAQTCLHRSPWCRNRWGQRYQALSLADYHYMRDGNPETYEARLLERVLRPGMMVVDVGAHHGLFSLEAIQHVGPQGRVHAFEPSPRTRSILEANLRSNRIRDVRVFPQALADEPGTAQLRIHTLSGLNSLTSQDIFWSGGRLTAQEIVEVEVTTLDIHAARHGIDWIDFLKIDVEGFELAVLRGIRGLLQRQRVGHILLEVGDLTCVSAGVQPEDVLAQLGELGYSVRTITPDGTIGTLVKRFPEGSFSANYLALPASSELPCGCSADCGQGTTCCSHA